MPPAQNRLKPQNSLSKSILLVIFCHATILMQVSCCVNNGKILVTKISTTLYRAYRYLHPITYNQFQTSKEARPSASRPQKKRRTDVPPTNYEAELHKIKEACAAHPKPQWIPQDLWDVSQTTISQVLSTATEINLNIEHKKSSEICFVCSCQRHSVKSSLLFPLSGFWHQGMIVIPLSHETGRSSFSNCLKIPTGHFVICVLHAWQRIIEKQLALTLKDNELAYEIVSSFFSKVIFSTPLLPS